MRFSQTPINFEKAATQGIIVGFIVSLGLVLATFWMTSDLRENPTALEEVGIE